MSKGLVSLLLAALALFFICCCSPEFDKSDATIWLFDQHRACCNAPDGSDVQRSYFVARCDVGDVYVSGSVVLDTKQPCNE